MEEQLIPMAIRLSKYISSLSLILGLLSMFPTVNAQTTTATVTGTITDTSGAVISNARVTAKNQGTQLEFTAVSGSSGVYTIPFLPVGDYVVSVEAGGFKKLVSNEIKLEVNQKARIDLKLQVGDISQSVEVMDVAPVLQTESASVGEVISGTTTANLPLNGRNFQQLTLLVPGAITYNPNSFNMVSLQNGQGRPLVNGNREQGNAFILDGAPIDDTMDNRIGYKPSVDAIAEFKVETSNSSSEYGNVTGATTNVSLKSGTNSFHGSLFEFIRNDALDARSWTINRTGAEKEKLRQNVYGGTIGGPIIKNKLFFFGDYQGTQQRTGGGTTVNVASEALRRGDLSSLSKYIRDPKLSGKCEATPAVDKIVPGVNYQAACFPGSKIPLDKINPVAKALFENQSYYPLPIKAHPSLPGVGVYNTTTANSVRGSQFDVKIDAEITQKDRFSSRYYFANFNEVGDKGALPITVTSKSFNRPQGLSFSWTRTITPTIINEARVGVSRAMFITNPNDWAGVGDLNNSFGIPGSQAVSGLSLIVLGNGLSQIGNRVITEDSVNNTFLFGDNLTFARDRHQFKMGVQLLRYQQNRFYSGNNGLLGGFTYNGRFTGQEYADFLLDLLRNKSIGNTGGQNNGSWGHRQNRWGVFFQDDYKFRPNLTFNLGMRWEYTSPVVEVNDRQANYVMYTGELQLAGKNGNSRALYNPYYKGFEPRIGIAWTPERFNNKLVVRAGYGITQFMEGTGSNLRLPLNFPFYSEADSTYDVAGTLKTGFGDAVAPGAPSGLIRVWDKDLRPQFTQQWNLTFEYQLLRSMSVSAAYVGHNATHLVNPTDFNQPLPGIGDPTKWAPPQTRRPLFGALPLVQGINGTASWGVSRYNSLQMSARQRFSTGIEFLASYTFSKALTDNRGYYGGGGSVASSGAYSYNQYEQRKYNYGLAFFDAKNNFMFSGSYELPIGKSRKYFNNMSSLLNSIVGGWNLTSILQFRSGFPITLTATASSTDPTLLYSNQSPRGGEKPDLVGNPIPLNQTIDNWINIAAFKAPAPGTFGNSPVGVIRAPGYSNWDLGISKKFVVKERHTIDFRSEFFNFTNHPNFGPPAVNFSTAGTFGKITSTVGSPRIMEFALKYSF